MIVREVKMISVEEVGEILKKTYNNKYREFTIEEVLLLIEERAQNIKTKMTDNSTPPYGNF